jgi:hypothetical protein
MPPKYAAGDIIQLCVLRPKQNWSWPYNRKYETGDLLRWRVQALASSS